MTQRRGFTLIEVLVAVAITGLVALLAHQLFGAVVDASRRIVAEREALDGERNARRYLRDAFLSLDVGDSTGFEGHPDHVAFAAWQRTADGWQERRRIELSQDGAVWLVVTSAGERVVLADSVTAVRLDYLLEPGAASPWVGEWISPVSAPLAVRMRITRWSGRADTTLYPIRSRG